MPKRDIPILSERIKPKFELSLIGAAARRSMFLELTASPKPGLVDRFGTGAHKDMDFPVFMKSINALAPFFSGAADTGFDFSGTDLTELLGRVRTSGLMAEKIMYDATGGVNTHKGQIFSLGILSAASGYLLSSGMILVPEEICGIAADMCSDIIETDLESLYEINGKRPLTYGERLYIDHGITGIRGEASKGFPSVINNALPVFENLMLRYPKNINDNMITALLCLMKTVDDSNILGRAGFEGLSVMRKTAGEALLAGGMQTDEGRSIVENMSELFIQCNMSPGGCADLLAVTVFLFLLKTEFNNE